MSSRVNIRPSCGGHGWWVSGPCCLQGVGGFGHPGQLPLRPRNILGCIPSRQELHFAVMGPSGGSLGFPSSVAGLSGASRDSHFLQAVRVGFLVCFGPSILGKPNCSLLQYSSLVKFPTLRQIKVVPKLSQIVRLVSDMPDGLGHPEAWYLML